MMIARPSNTKNLCLSITERLGLVSASALTVERVLTLWRRDDSQPARRRSRRAHSPGARGAVGGAAARARGAFPVNVRLCPPTAHLLPAAAALFCATMTSMN